MRTSVRATGLFIAGTLIAALAVASDSDEAEIDTVTKSHNSNRCAVVLGTGTAQVNAEQTAVESDFDLLIDGRPYSASSDGIVMGVTEVRADGSIVFVTSSDWHIPRLGARFTTVETVLVEPPNDEGVSRSQLHREVLTGNRFNCGRLLDESTVTVDGQVEFLRVIGKLCRCR